MPDSLDDLAAQFSSSTAEVAELKARLSSAQQRVKDLRPRLTTAIVDEIHAGRRGQAEISRLTGYTPERIRQLCREGERGTVPAEVKG